MVVIILISLLAIMAVPAMKTARDDRMAFDYARQFQAIIHRGEIRAMSRGAAHLVLIDTNGSRGRATLFEAVDFTPAAQSGPKPVSSCRGQRDLTGTFINHWAEAEAWTPGTFPVRSPLIDNVTLDGPGVEAGMGLSARIIEHPTTQRASIALCYTPGGNVYYGAGATASAAVTAMRTSTPFNGSLEVEIARHDAATNVLGLRRRVIVAGGSAPRIVSQ